MEPIEELCKKILGWKMGVKSSSWKMDIKLMSYRCRRSNSKLKNW